MASVGDSGEESGRNGYTRGGEHLSNQLVEDENKSVLKLHSNHHHDGRDVRYTMRVTRVHNDSLESQGVVLGALGRTLKCSRLGRRLGRWSLGATEERRRGRGFLGHVCERESLIQSVMLYLVS